MKPKQEESGPKVPGYIVTFSDMITLLLTFFVLLLSLADVQDPELFNKGRDSFWQSLHYSGLGILFGHMGKNQMGSFKSMYHVEDGGEEEAETRTVDARLERVKRCFRDIKDRMEVVDSQIVGRRTDFSVMSVNFSPGGWELGSADKQALEDFCRGLEQGGGSGKIYVLGLCTDGSEQQQWLVSARRAKVVADYMGLELGRDNSTDEYSGITGQGSWPVYWWGAGGGGEWVERESFAHGDSHIMVAVMRGDATARRM